MEGRLGRKGGGRRGGKEGGVGGGSGVECSVGDQRVSKETSHSSLVDPM